MNFMVLKIFHIVMVMMMDMKISNGKVKGRRLRKVNMKKAKMKNASLDSKLPTALKSLLMAITSYPKHLH